jgi:hypothetical protein
VFRPCGASCLGIATANLLTLLLHPAIQVVQVLRLQIGQPEPADAWALAAVWGGGGDEVVLDGVLVVRPSGRIHGQTLHPGPQVVRNDGSLVDNNDAEVDRVLDLALRQLGVLLAGESLLAYLPSLTGDLVWWGVNDRPPPLLPRLRLVAIDRHVVCSRSCVMMCVIRLDRIARA